MTEQSPGVDLPALLANLVQQQTAVVQQQTAMVQQQAALLQVHSESLQLQRLLVERLLGGTLASVAVSQSEAPALTTASQPPAAPQPTPLSVTPATHRPVTPSRGPETAGAERGDDIPSTRAADTVAPPAAGIESGAGVRPIASHTARYYQSRAAPAMAPVQPQDLELMRRLHEMRDASDLILRFGPHQGNTLGQVAMHDPDYVRQLVVRAQRPEVRAAAGRLVEALDAAAAHKPRAGRGAGRRSRPTM